ncbi:hypothetical protein FS837_008915 [Tulasnella sp. UAMH 9824]|nr:hypothetical protein FS837_008915 [Tulasnella sp. UAMH 9824]
MLENLFRPRRSTVSPLPAFQIGPTIAKPTNPKPSSSLVTKLKELKKVLRPSRSNKKNDDRSSQRSQKTHKPSPSDESWGNLTPGPFTAEDYEFRRTPPSPTRQDLCSITNAIGLSSSTGAPTTIQAAYPESNPYSAPLAATLETHRQAAVPVSIPIIQRYNSELVTHQPAHKQRALASKSYANIDGRRTEKQSKWWEIGGDLRNKKRHFRREAIDYGNPNADYCNTSQLGNHGNSLKRGRANQRRQRPQKHASRKGVHESDGEVENEDIVSQDNAERAHRSTAPSPPKRYGQRLYPKSTGRTVEPNHQLEWRFLRVSAAHHTVPAARQPLASLDPNLVAIEGAQLCPQAEASEHSDGGDSSCHENGVQAPNPTPSWWLGQQVFFEGENPGPSQL